MEERGVFKYKESKKPVTAKDEIIAVSCADHGGSGDRCVYCDAETVDVLQNCSPFSFNERRN
jgi:histone acetyltransferase (RNA polymerase elongator complex component)